jgi:hypothetical protein
MSNLGSAADLPMDTLITVGSPSTPFPQNKQNEPSVAVDASNPMVLAAGANDELDLAPAVGSSAPFTPGVGISGIYFSFDGGATWKQPTYPNGWSARMGTAGVGPIGTLPNYYQNGLVSDGDPSLAFGPSPGPDGRFSWNNGSRLYYANLTANFSTVRTEQTFRGFMAIAVSHTDDPTTAAQGGDQGAAAWSQPVVVTQQQSATTFSDKDSLWADNAASSPHFGNVYVSWTSFRSQEKSPNAVPEPIMFSHSTDGGVTWSTPIQLSAAVNNAQIPGRQGSIIRTDSNGVVYVFWEGFDKSLNQDVEYMTRSFNGGVTFEQPRPVATVFDVGQPDPVQPGYLTFDGVAGARTDSFPSVDIANGAPTGQGAPNTIVLTWADARNGLNHEQALVQYSTDGGVTWTTPVNAAESGDRPDFPAVAISPNGQDVYLTYDAFLDPWQSTTSAPRRMQGVVRHASLNNGQLSSWTTLHRGAIGDARGSSANSLVAEFIGDYNSIVATNTSGIAAWNDVRNAADYPAIDAYRQSVVDGSPVSKPVLMDGPPTFGNSDIFGGSFKPTA